MIRGVGTDIVEVSRIKKALARGDGFVERVFTDAERDYCLSVGTPARSFAGRFAAKEAVAKCLGTSLSWRDVEVLPDESGKPVVRLMNEAAALADGCRVMVSISHCRSYAIAHAVATTD